MPVRVRRGLGCALLLLAGATPPATGQAPQGAPGATTTPAAAAGRSLLVPGWGQWAQGKRRGALYAAAEVALWIVWADRRSSAAEFRAAYRDLAWEAARSGSTRSDGPWSYYEHLSKWTRSGAFDADPGAPGLQPEEDPSTYNGSQWRLARDIHFAGTSAAPGDPRYESALAYYRSHAYAPDFLWDWTGKEAQRAEFEALIDRSDARFRQATTLLGAVLANHLLSAGDAFVSARLPGQVRMRVAPPAGHRTQHTFTLSWTPPL